MVSTSACRVLITLGLVATFLAATESAPAGAVLGIDLGTDNAVIAIARRKGVDIVANEASQRLTPCIVSFSEKQRFIGEGGLGQKITNIKNTVIEPKKLVGRLCSDPEFAEIRSGFNVELVDKKGEPNVKVSLAGKQLEFSPTQLVAMLLGNFKSLAHVDHGSEVVDCAISVPAFFNEAQRNAIREAARIAGLKCLRVMNDNTATALSYGIIKTDLSEKDPRRVVFVDCGHSCVQVSVVAFLKGQLKVLSHTFDRTISGSAIDDMLVEHFAEEFKGKYKVDARTNARAMVRLRAQSEKLKKTLSANPMDLDTPINVECMMEDTDVSGMLRREQLEQMLDKHGYVAKLTNVVQGALDLADLKPGDVDTVEMVGGTSRIPALRAAVSAVFGQDPKTTVNAAESVARGCALAAAMLSPAFRVRDFSVVDWNTMPLKVEYSDGKSSGTVTLEQGVAVPSAKQIKLTARGPLSLRFLQASAATTPAAKEELIAEKRALVGAKVPGGSELKVSVGLDLDSCASVPSCAIETVEEVAVPHETPKPAQAVGTNDKKEGKRDKKGKKGEKDQKEEGADEDTVEADHVDGTGREGGDAPMPDVPEPKSKTVTRQEKIEVETVHYLGLSDKALAEATNIEFDLQLADRVVQETFAARNALEEYVYRMRDALATTLADFADESVKASFLKALDSTEEWLYGEGEEAGKSVFLTRLEELRGTGDPIERRAREHAAVPTSLAKLAQKAQACAEQARTTDKLFDHITQEERDSVMAAAEKAAAFAEAKQAAHSGSLKTADPAVLAADIDAERAALDSLTRKVMMKPKPAPPAPQAPPSNPAASEGSREAQAGGEGNGVPGEGADGMMDEEEKGEGQNEGVKEEHGDEGMVDLENMD